MILSLLAALREGLIIMHMYKPYRRKEKPLQSWEAVSATYILRNMPQISEIIGQNHLLLSEYPPDTKPQKHQFPERNRIISGLSIGTVVTEAKEKRFINHCGICIE